MMKEWDQEWWVVAMLEAILAWGFLIGGAIFHNTHYFIASGLFAIAAQIYLLKKEGEDK